jgi:ornithine--oxo-acid transaminase
MASRLATNYSSLPVTIVRAKHIFLWDIHNKLYMDLLSGYSAVNQGHCHPRIINALVNQAEQVTLTSRVVQSESLFKWADYITNKFKYDNVLAMNSGAEAVETALKLARKYGNIRNRSHIVCLNGNFHGRTLGTVSLSDYQPYRAGFGPFIDKIIHVEMNHVAKLQQVFEQHGSTISAVLYEPVQGEGGVVPMTDEFIKAMRDLKRMYHDVLFMADEIQSGLGRTGKLTTSADHFHFKPDVLILGKALSGGVLPMSCILGNHDIMSVFTPGTHGSTFGGNPLACAVSMEAVDVLEKECIPNVASISPIMKNMLHDLPRTHISDIRGMGMFWGVQFHKEYDVEALRLRMLDAGYITCTSRNNTLRITPPLIISRGDVITAIKQLEKCIPPVKQPITL